MEAEVPMSGGRKIPIIADEYVDMDFGTGCLKVTPGHDSKDYEIGKRFNLPIITIMNKVLPRLRLVYSSALCTPVQFSWPRRPSA